MQLFLSILASHNPVSSSTIARWIKQTLQASGVDVSTFSAHSTKGAATIAAALAGISTQEIMNQAGWARESTFYQFYFRPPKNTNAAGAFGRAVLRPEPTEVTNMQRTC